MISLGGGNQRVFYIPSTECHNQGLEFVEKVTKTLTRGDISTKEQTKMIDDIYEEFCDNHDRDDNTYVTETIPESTNLLTESTELVTLNDVEFTSNGQITKEIETIIEKDVQLSSSAINKNHKIL